jgi:O-antigen/teichoic acid export membrane protein
VVTNIVVARTIGPEGKGLISFLGYALFVAVNLGGLGLHAAAIQQIGKRRFAPETIAGAQILLSLGTGVLCVAGMALILPLYRQRMDLAPEILLRFLPLILMALLQLSLNGVLVGLGRIKQANLLQTVTPLAWVLGAIVVLAMLGGDKVAGARVWIAAQALGPLVTLAWVIVAVRPRFRGLAGCARAALRFGLEAYLANLVWALLLRIDVMLMGYLSGAREVGIYSVAVLLAEMLWYLSRSLATALSPRIAGGTPEEALRLTHRAARTSFWTVALGAVVLLPFAGLLIRLTFGGEFLPSVRPFMLLLPGIALGTIASPLSLYFTQQRGRPRVNAFVSAIGLAVNVGLNAYLIPRYGASGAAFASSVSYGLVALLLLNIFRREPGFSLDLLLRPRAEDLNLIKDLWRSGLAAVPGRRAGPQS